MIYPKFIKKGDFIGITAPSDGVIKESKINRLNNAELKFKAKGFEIIETENVRSSEKGRSSSAVERAKQLEKLYLNKKIKSIFCVAGGDYLLEILPYLNFKIISKNPKWIQGFSDPTALLYTITTKLDIATIYSNNFTSFGMEEWHCSLNNNLEILKGNIAEQCSFEKYESIYQDYVTGLETYNLNENVKWENLFDENEIVLKGRIIGGCFDVLLEIMGTRFDYTAKFISKYKKDGFVWFFDICQQTSEDIIRGMWKFKELGYFKYCKGIIFGRIGEERSCYDVSFRETIKDSLGCLNVPIIINADIGHKPPQLTIINGALCEIYSKDGKGRIKFNLR